MNPLHRRRLGQLLGMTASEHDGEALNALRLAQSFMRQHEITWFDVLVAAGDGELVAKLRHDLDIATQACALLLAENEKLRAKAPEWQTTTVVASGRDHRSLALWCLDLANSGRIRFNDFEQRFLRSVAGWDGALKAKQQPVFQRILERVDAVMAGRAS